MSKTSNRPGRSGLWTAAGIFGLAMVVRLVYMYEVAESPRFFTPIVDSGEYDRIAKSLAEGKPMDAAFFWQAFFYPMFLSCVYFFSGASIIFAKLVQILLGSAVCVFGWRLGKQLFDSRTGVLAGIITAMYGPLVFFDNELLATVWASVWSVVLISLFLKARQKKTPAVYLTLGICGGLSIITRATFLPFFV